MGGNSRILGSTSRQAATEKLSPTSSIHPFHPGRPGADPSHRSVLLSACTLAEEHLRRQMDGWSPKIHGWRFVAEVEGIHILQEEASLAGWASHVRASWAVVWGATGIRHGSWPRISCRDPRTSKTSKGTSSRTGPCSTRTSRAGSYAGWSRGRGQGSSESNCCEPCEPWGEGQGCPTSSRSDPSSGPKASRSTGS